MQELSLHEVENVNGGIVPLIVAGASALGASEGAALAIGVVAHLAVRAGGVYTLTRLLRRN